MRNVCIPAALAAIVLCGCSTSYPLTVTNRATYEMVVEDYTQAGLTVALRTAVADNEKPERFGLLDRKTITQLLAQDVAAALIKQADYNVIFPAEGMEKADVRARFCIVEFERSALGTNFFIAWPGFLINAHEKNGYGYEIVLTVRCELTAAVTGAHIGVIDVPITLEIRHASYSTTLFNYLGWPTLSIDAFLNGFTVIQYNPELDYELPRAIFPTLGAHVASEIIKTVNALPWETENALSF